MGPCSDAGAFPYQEVTKMRIYHSELTVEVAKRYREVQPDKPLRVLISYGRRHHQTGGLMLNHRTLINGLIMDSGAYTLNSNPVKYSASITFSGYKAYLKQLADKVDFYFNYDAIFDKNGFDTNFGYQVDLELAGLTPVPVIHDCYGSEVQFYIDRGHKLIAIGSGELKFAGRDELYNILAPFHRTGVKVHFLGCTEFEKLAYLPVYSADSTTWNRTGSSGNIFYWNPLRIGYKKLDKAALDDGVRRAGAKFHIRTYPFRRQLEAYLCQELKLGLDDLYGREQILNRSLVNLHYFVLIEEYINHKHKEQGFNTE